MAKKEEVNTSAAVSDSMQSITSPDLCTEFLPMGYSSLFSGGIQHTLNVGSRYDIIVNCLTILKIMLA